MSLQALTWVLDYSKAGGTDRLVMFSLGHHADNDGYVALGRATLASETLLSEITTKRILDRLATTPELDACDAERGPDWWLAIPRNRRPRLFRLPLFAANRGVNADTPPGGAQGARRGRAGVHATPSDQAVRDANVERRTDKKESGVDVSENPTDPLADPNDKEPDPGCIRCSGSGRLYRGGNAATGALDVRCSCTFIRQPAEILAGLEAPQPDADPSPPPWIAAGMPYAEWREMQGADADA